MLNIHSNGINSKHNEREISWQRKLYFFNVVNVNSVNVGRVCKRARARVGSISVSSCIAHHIPEYHCRAFFRVRPAWVLLTLPCRRPCRSHVFFFFRRIDTGTISGESEIPIAKTMHRASIVATMRVIGFGFFFPAHPHVIRNRELGEWKFAVGNYTENYIDPSLWAKQLSRSEARARAGGSPSRVCRLDSTNTFSSYDISFPPFFFYLICVVFSPLLLYHEIVVVVVARFVVSIIHRVLVVLDVVRMFSPPPRHAALLYSPRRALNST